MRPLLALLVASATATASAAVLQPAVPPAARGLPPGVGVSRPGAANGQQPSDPNGTSVAIWRGMLVVTTPAGGRPDLSRLRQPLDVSWDDTSLSEAVADIQARTRLNIVVVPPSGDRRVSLKVKAMPLGEVLGWMERLSGARLGAMDGAVAFSDEPLRGPPVTRLYDVHDLLPVMSTDQDPASQEASLVDLIQRTVVDQHNERQAVRP